MFRLFRDWVDRNFSDPQVVILAVLLLSGLVFILMLGKILTPVLAAIVIAYLLDGMVVFLKRIKIPRPVSVMIVFLLFMTSLLLIIIVLMPILSVQIGQFLQELPSYVSNIQKELMLLPQKYPDFISETQIKKIIEFLNTELTSLGQRLLSLSIASVKGLISILVYLILVPLMVFFFLKDKKLLHDWMSGFLPDHRGLAIEVWREVNLQIGNYVRGKIWEILIVWSVSYIVFFWLGLQFAMLLSLFVGLSVLVPYIGATVMSLPVALVAYFQWGWGSSFAYTVLSYFIIQALDGNLLVPLLLSGVVNLHPVAIIVAVLVFGGLWGIWGLFFAIPLATLVHALIKAWASKHKKIEVSKGKEATS